jgi:hypothetical protein
VRARGVTVGYEGVVRRDPQPVRRRVARTYGGHRPKGRAARQPWPPSGRRAGRGALSPVAASLTLLGVLGLGGLAALGPLAPLMVVLVLVVGLVAAAVVILPMELIRMAMGRGAVTRPDPATRPEPAWAGARERFDRLRTEFAGYECDPIAVLRLPALADVTVASTARFVDALAEAQSLLTDRHPGDGPAARFAAAVEHAEQAWQAARDAAGRIRMGTLTPAERAAVERVIKLLTVARDTDSEPERLVAYERARTELGRLDRAGTVHVPLPARAALDEAARGALPG